MSQQSNYSGFFFLSLLSAVPSSSFISLSTLTLHPFINVFRNRLKLDLFFGPKARLSSISLTVFLWPVHTPLQAVFFFSPLALNVKSSTPCRSLLYFPPVGIHYSIQAQWLKLYASRCCRRVDAWSRSDINSMLESVSIFRPNILLRFNHWKVILFNERSIMLSGCIKQSVILKR